MIEISDVQGQGSTAHAYRLRLGPPRPEFRVQSYPSVVNVAAGQAVPVTFSADREDGFTGPIEIEIKDALPGFKLVGGLIPAGCAEITMTLHAPSRGRPGTQPLRFEASAVCNGIRRSLRVLPMDAVTQAIILNEFVSAQDSLVSVFFPGSSGRPAGKRNLSAFQNNLGYRKIEKAAVPAGGWFSLDIRKVSVPPGSTLNLELADAPEGVRLRPYEPGSQTLILEASEDAPIGESANLIILASIEVPSENSKRPAARRVPLGAFPALPCSVIPHR